MKTVKQEAINCVQLQLSDPKILYKINLTLFDNKSLAKIIKLHFPTMMKVINQLLGSKPCASIKRLKTTRTQKKN